MNKRDLIFYGVVTVILSVMFYQNIMLSRRLSDMEDRNIKTELALPDSFDYVFNRFKVYNSDVDTNTVLLFIKSVDYYDLNKKGILEMLVGQILLESNARHVYASNHANAGQVIRGTSGEVGISQIMPTTALHYLQRIAEDDYSLYDFGVSDYSFANNDDLTKEVKLNLTIKWLSRIENNFALWGLIMREGLESNGILEAFVIYNAGKGGLNRHISSNGTISNHKYLVGIKTTIKVSSEAIDV